LLHRLLTSRHRLRLHPIHFFKRSRRWTAKLFDAYNHCDLEKLGSLLADDLEFYHDKSGLTSGRQALVEGVKNNICGKVTRELVPGTLEVYPIANYGAVEIGVHRFHHPGHENTESVGEAQFIHLWQKQRWSMEDHSCYQLRPPFPDKVNSDRLIAMLSRGSVVHSRLTPFASG